MTRDPHPSPLSPDSPRPPVRTGAGPLPYLAATGLASAAMAVLVVGLAFPAPAVVPIGLLFLAVAAAVRWLEDLPPDGGGRVLSWVANRIRGLGRDYGVEFYGIASITAFLRAEAMSLAETDLSLPELAADPLGSVLGWLVAEAFESILNAVSAAFWWLDLYQAVPDSHGWPAFIGILVAGWGVWRVLGTEPPPRDPLVESLGEELGEGLEGLTDDLGGGLGGWSDGRGG